jgi:hypothetical protein
MKYIYYKYKIRDCVRKKLITFYNVADDIVLDFFCMCCRHHVIEVGEYKKKKRTSERARATKRRIYTPRRERQQHTHKRRHTAHRDTYTTITITINTHDHIYFDNKFLCEE